MRLWESIECDDHHKSIFSNARLPQPPSAIWNLIDGYVRGTRVVVFDCRFGHGKASLERTMFAITGPTEAARTASLLTRNDYARSRRVVGHSSISIIRNPACE